MRNIFLGASASLAVLFGVLFPAEGQWMTQTVAVNNGWTAVYLYVDASSQSLIPGTPGLPLSPGNPIDKIWLWKAPISTAQYLSSPSSPLSGGGPWISWGITNAQNSLTALIPNAAYLIHSTAATNYVWTIKGRPTPPAYTWDMTGLNFLGFPTPPTNPPNFGAFFAQAPVINGIVQIYQYVGGEFSTNPASANPAAVLQPQYVPVTRGKAVWVGATNVNNTYFGPFQVSLPNPKGLDFGSSGGQLTFHLINLTPNPLTVSMALSSSETPPYGQTNIVAAPPLLLEGALNTSNLTYGYTVLSTNNAGGASNSVSWTLPPYGQSGSDIAVTLGVNRFAMANNPGLLYAGILQFTDSLGFSDVNIPVTATTANTAGLWVGNANVNQVSYDLKSYATNSDGSFVLTSVTNQVVTTNALAFGISTNLSINVTDATNTEVDYYNLSNVVINTYTSNNLQIATSGLAVATNSVVSYSATTVEVIQTTVTGYYLTNNGTLPVWITSTVTNAPVVTIIPTATNLFSFTNLIAVVPSNGTPVSVTATNFGVYTSAYEVVTNGPLQASITNTAYSYYELTNQVAGTAAAYNLSTTNVFVYTYSVTNGPVGTNYVVTNAPVAAMIPAVTNYFLAAAPLVAITNGPNFIAVNLVTNNYVVTSAINPVYLTNFVTISNNFILTAGATNLIGSSTNLVTASYPAQGISASNSYTTLALAFTTNAAYLIITNPLVTSVSNYVVTAHNTSLDSVVAPFPLRLIVFNGTNNTSCLLQRVYYGLRQDTNLVIATTESVLDASHLNIARRISAPHLPWAATNNPYYFSGGGLAQGTTLTTTVTEPYDDQAANPFLHTYHPDHNNLDFSQNPPHELPQGSQSYTITRTIQLAVTPTQTDFLSLTTANTLLSGAYYETISLAGLGGATRSYQTAGTFTLKQISPITVLTTQ